MMTAGDGSGCVYYVTVVVAISPEPEIAVVSLFEFLSGDRSPG